MADQGAGRSTSRRNSIVSLGLVGVPPMQESVQTANEFDFDFDISDEQDAEMNAHIDAFCASDLSDGQSLNSLQITPPIALNFAPPEAAHPSVFSEQYPLHPFGANDLGLFPVQQDFAYPEPSNYFLAHPAPYFDQDYSALPPSNEFFGSMGLTAIPGSNAFAEGGFSQSSSQAVAYPTETWMMAAGAASVPAVQTDRASTNNTSYDDTTTQFASYPSQESRAPMLRASLSIGPVPSAVVKKGSQQDLFESDSDSDEDYQDSEPKPTRKSKQAIQKKARNDSVSSASTSAPGPAEPVKYVPGEKPQKVDAKPWIRTNANTEGDTRTAKINNWKNKYEYQPLPLGTWSSGKYTYKYTQYENVDFLTEAPMSTRKVREYILNYPSDDEKRLVLWIQKMPADQGRRYGSKQHSKCVFRDCPIQRYVEGTISTGEYRVAFDEKHFTYGDEVDPYDCAAYAHLYCMEQFLDFDQVCQIADVRVDTRIDMPLEPNGKAAFSMVDVPARHEMERFVRAASKGRLRQTQRWSQYPVHNDFSRDEQKPHERTLTYLAHCMYEAHQDDSHKRQAALRRVTVSQRRVHLGDLEMSVADKRIMLEVYGGKKKNRNANIEEHYDQRIRFHIARAEQEARDFLKSKRRRKESSSKGKKRKMVEREDSEEESAYESTADWQPRKLRASRQKKQRVNYAESPIESQQQCAQASYMPIQRTQPPAAPEQQVQHLHTYIPGDGGYMPETGHSQAHTNPTLDTPYGLYTIPATPKFDIADFSDFPTGENDLPGNNIENLFALERRQSLVTEIGPMSILKSPVPARSGRTAFARRAAFGAQPVSDSKEYRVNDPPSLMSGRRSARLAEKKGCERRMRRGV